MTHRINALIGSRQTLSRLIDRLGAPEPTQVPFGLVIVPLDDKRLDEIGLGDGPSIGDFCYLTRGLADEIGKWLEGGRVIYIETDYFGGMGRQHAAMIENGELVWHRSASTFPTRSLPDILAGVFFRRQKSSKSPISEGLAKLGVTAGRESDEFDTIGLGEFRVLEALGCSEDDWDEE